MQDISFEDLENLILEVPVERQYWLIRINRNDYFSDFLAGKYIATDYNEIGLQNLKEPKWGEIESKVQEVSEIIRTYRPNEKASQKAALQLFVFSSIKKGDVVILPNKNASAIAFGIVRNSRIFLKNIDRDAPGKNDECLFFKRKKVEWIETKDRNALDPSLLKILFSRKIINISDYSSIIDRILSSLFLKNDQLHTVLYFPENKSFNATELLSLTFLIKAAKEIDNEYFGRKGTLDDVDIKINIQSPGWIEIIEKNKKTAIGLFAVVIQALVGGNLDIKLLKWSNPGIFKAVQDYLDHGKNRELKTQILELTKTKIVTPEEAAKLFEALNGDSEETSTESDSKSTRDSDKTKKGSKHSNPKHNRQK